MFPNLGRFEKSARKRPEKFLKKMKVPTLKNDIFYSRYLPTLAFFQKIWIFYKVPYLEIKHIYRNLPVLSPPKIWHHNFIKIKISLVLDVNPNSLNFFNFFLLVLSPSQKKNSGEDLTPPNYGNIFQIQDTYLV